MSLTQAEQNYKDIAIGDLKQAISRLDSAQAAVVHVPSLISVNRFINDVAKLVRSITDFVEVDL